MDRSSLLYDTNLTGLAAIGIAIVDIKCFLIDHVSSLPRVQRVAWINRLKFLIDVPHFVAIGLAVVVIQ